MNPGLPSQGYARSLEVEAMKSISVLVIIAWLALLAGCSHEVGSEAWCKDMKEKPKREWSASEMADYTKYCVFK